MTEKWAEGSCLPAPAGAVLQKQFNHEVHYVLHKVHKADLQLIFSLCALW